MTSILSFDPAGKGGDTGIVVLDYLSTMAPRVRESWAISGGYDAFCDWLRFNEDINPDVVIVETFIHFKDIHIETTPILIEGAIRYVWPNAVLSPASGKNTAMPNDMMERIGFSKKDFAGDHHSDRWEALRHALRYLKNNKHIPTLRLISG